MEKLNGAARITSIEEKRLKLKRVENLFGKKSQDVIYYQLSIENVVKLIN